MQLKFALLTDEADSHGLSIFYFGAQKENVRYADTAVVGTAKLKLAGLAQTIQSLPSFVGFEHILVTDLPIDRTDVESVLNAFKKLAEVASKHEIQVWFLDHHPTPPEIVDQLKSAGVHAFVKTGLWMSVALYKFVNEGVLPTEDLNVLQTMLEVLENGGPADLTLLLLGNVADMDRGIAEVFNFVGLESPAVQNLLKWGLAFDVLSRSRRLSLARYSAEMIVEMSMKLAEELERNPEVYPPAKYSEVIHRECKRVENVGIFWYSEDMFPRSWLNKTVSYYLVYGQNPPKYLVVPSTGLDPRTGKERSSVLTYTSWLNTQANLLNVLREVAQELGPEWVVYGHPTFAILSREGRDEEGLRKAVEAVVEKLKKLD